MSHALYRSELSRAWLSSKARACAASACREKVYCACFAVSVNVKFPVPDDT